MKKILTAAFMTLLLATNSHAQGTPASMQGKSTKISTQPAPAPEISPQDSYMDMMPDQLKQAISPEGGLTNEEVKKRVEAAKSLLHSPKVNEKLAWLKTEKTTIIQKLKDNDCLDPGFDVQVGKFIDKLTSRSYNEQSLYMGFASMFTAEEMREIESTIENPDPKYQSRLGSIAIRFVMNEDPQLFSQVLKLSQKKECLQKQNLE